MYSDRNPFNTIKIFILIATVFIERKTIDMLSSMVSIQTNADENAKMHCA